MHSLALHNTAQLLAADTHYPTATTHAHTLHPTHPLQLQDSYGTAVRSATKLVGEDEAGEGGDGQEGGDDAGMYN